MVLTGVQIIGALFGVLLLYLAFVHQKRREFTIKEWIAWSGLAIVFIILALFPQILDPVTVRLKIFRALDFMVILGFMFMIIAIFYTYTLSRTNQKKLEIIIRSEAIGKTLKNIKNRKR